MNKQNKLARNAIRARKAQKKRVNEQDKPKKGKRWLTRIFSLLGCLLLVSALVVPCFADESALSENTSSPVIDYNGVFFDAYGIEQGMALERLISVDDAWHNMYLYQFTGALVGEPVALDEPLTFNDIVSNGSVVCVTGKNIENEIFIRNGHWQTQYSSSGTNRTIFLKFYQDTNEVLSIRIKYDYETYLVSESTIKSTVYSIDGSYFDYDIACASPVEEKAVLDYWNSMRYGEFSVIGANYSKFVEIVDATYNKAYDDAYELGYFEGEKVGYQKGFADGAKSIEFDSTYYNNVFDAFTTTLDPRSDTSAYDSVVDYYYGFGDSRLLNVKTLISGTANVGYNSNYADSLNHLNSMTGGTIRQSIDLDYFYIVVNSNSGIKSAFGDGYVVFSQFSDIQYQSIISIQFYDGDQEPIVHFTYSSTSHSSGQDVTLSNIYIDGVTHDCSTISDIEIAFTVNNIETQDMLPTICALLFLDDITYYEDVVYSPWAFSQGYSTSYNLGYEDGNRYGYQNGFDEGYEKGKEDGGGTDYDTAQEAFQAGYDKAVSEIDSGKFGENFLGNVFSAPIKAVQGIPLVLLPDGNVISLGHVISALIALLLVLAFVKIYSR